MIIAIETSTPVCSVALGDNGRCLAEKRIEGRGVHSEYTFTYLEEFRDRYSLSNKNIKCVLFSGGPGSYTGLRIGAAAIKGFLFQREIPLFVYPTLLSFAVPLADDTSKEIHSVIDARRDHLYHQKITLKAGGGMEAGEAAARQISEIEKELDENSYIAGTGWERLNTDIVKAENRFGTEVVSAKNLIEAWYNPKFKSRFKKENPASFEPNYITLSQINNSSVRSAE